MALRYIDSFDHYTTAQASRKWTTFSGSGISAGAGRRSTAGLLLSQNASYTKVLGAAHATWIVGFSFKPSGIPGGTTIIFSLRDEVTEQVSIRMPAGTTTLQLTRNGTALGSPTASLSVGTTYYIELKVTIDNAAGSYELRIDGVAAIGPTGSADTQNTANASANGFTFGLISNSATMNTTAVDDLYVCDGSGSVNNDFLGDCRVDAKLPDGAGATTGLTPSAGSNFQNVDDNPADDDTTYNEHATDGTKDTYTVEDLTHTPTNVYGVQIVATAKKDDAGIKGCATVVRSDGVDYDGATAALGTSYGMVHQIRELDPDGDVVWTDASFNAAQFGFKVKDI